MFRPLSFLLALFGLLCARPLAAAEELLPGISRILFLGDSITHGGTYVEFVDAFLYLHYPKRQFELLNLGLSSETVSGLSEEGHAGGKFPRPDLHERLDRILAKTKPQLIFACYGMNDGIYLPLDEARTAKFREGMIRLHEKAVAAGAQIIHLTPPTFDPGPGANPEAFNYNQVLDAYTIWLLGQRAQGWKVFDLHTAMNAELAANRIRDPEFRFAKDHIHPDANGHWIMARELLRGLGQSDSDLRSSPILKLVHQRSRILGDAWLTETKHLRPGVAAGLPLDEANAKAAALDIQIRQAVQALGAP